MVTKYKGGVFVEDLDKKVMEAVNYINGRININPEIAIIIGSGLGPLAYEIQDRIEIRYDEIPYFKSSTTAGHEGKLIFGKIYDKNVVAMQGRLHYYEGYSMQEIAFPIRVFAILGVSILIATNAAGGINTGFRIGDLMLITDHINTSGDSPLRGPNYELFGTRFPSMKNVYDKNLINIAKQVGRELQFDLKEGVYAFMPGPQYETDAEIKMLGILGANAVGMSTVPEVIAAAHSGMAVLGISFISNLTGINGNEPSHDEVLEVASKVEPNFAALVMDTIKMIKFND